jgi:hypothetical protein
MNQKQKKDFVYLALTDIYHEFNSSINHMLILRNFLQDVLNIKEGKETVYEFPSVLKQKYKK